VLPVVSVVAVVIEQKFVLAAAAVAVAVVVVAWTQAVDFDFGAGPSLNFIFSD
jgi:hypothetical protein